VGHEPSDGTASARLRLPAALARGIAAITADREHGASWLARRGAALLADASAPAGARDPARRLAQLQVGARQLAHARPSMAAVANTAARIWLAAADAQAAGAEAAQALAALHAGAARLAGLWDDAARAIGDAAIPELAGTLYTHSRSGTVEQVLTRLAAERARYAQPAEIVVSVSYPGFEGRAAARALAQAGWSVTLVVDAACGAFVPRCAAVVCGADSVLADGRVVNKVGTYPLALVARAASVPFYVLCETLKIAAPGFPLVLEEMPPEEILSAPISNVAARNPYFDITPAEDVTAIFTERGRLTPAQLAEQAATAGRALAALA
jgi:ribose 1,5-bisphosphate isomerase